jgi:D-glycero-alpha-D-manno-heptose-7-phosphate kinase
MIISRTPFRISFLGGGSDIPDFFLEEGRQMLSTTINKFCSVTTRNLPRFFQHTIRSPTRSSSTASRVRG